MVMLESCRRVYAQISLDAVRRNMDYLKSKTAPKTRMIAVIKADGYGHGAVPIARELEPLDYMYGFGVATAEEAFALRSNGIRKPILVLGYTFPYSYERLIREDIRITVFRNDMLEDLAGICVGLQKKGIQAKARVHIKVDTGMSRIGVRPDEAGAAFVEKAFSTEGLEVEGIFTHFARADEADKSETLKQLSEFRNFFRLIKEKTGREIPVKHCSNSAAVLEMPEANMDLVRAGIALYGLWPSGEVKREDQALIPALSLYSRIVYIKEIEAGTSVSYGGIFTAPHRMRIATIPVGYGDGYPRLLSGRGAVLLHGKRAPVLGRICMDQFMIDVSGIPEAAEGDQVTLIGRDGREEITMEELGELSGRFHYEFACMLGRRIPRVYTKGGEILSVRSNAAEY